MTFKAYIISSRKYRKLKKVRYGVYFMLLFLGGLIISPRNAMYQRLPSIVERLQIDLGFFLMTSLIVILIAVGLYLFSTRHEEIGELTLSTNQIQIKVDDTLQTYSISNVTDLKIERGATFHYAYKERNYLQRADNWISFVASGQVHQYEFLLESIEQNRQFEILVQKLRKGRFPVFYASI